MMRRDCQARRPGQVLLALLPPRRHRDSFSWRLFLFWFSLRDATTGTTGAAIVRSPRPGSSGGRTTISLRRVKLRQLLERLDGFLQALASNLPAGMLPFGHEIRRPRVRI